MGLVRGQHVTYVSRSSDKTSVKPFKGSHIRIFWILRELLSVREPADEEEESGIEQFLIVTWVLSSDNLNTAHYPLFPIKPKYHKICEWTQTKKKKHSNTQHKNKNRLARRGNDCGLGAILTEKSQNKKRRKHCGENTGDSATVLIFDFCVLVAQSVRFLTGRIPSGIVGFPHTHKDFWS